MVAGRGGKGGGHEVPEIVRDMLPSGRLIMREYVAGALTKETHAYGALDIAIIVAFENGKKDDEQYVVKGTMASRAAYERARVRFVDMPAAGLSFTDDGCDSFTEEVAKEGRDAAKAARTHVPEPEVAKRSDAFCERLIAKGERRDAIIWIKKATNTLGEMTHAKSIALVNRLVALGCVEIHACDVDKYPDGHENTGHLVIELPGAREKRAKILDKVAKLAADQGFDRVFDDGQRYVYAGLD